MSVEPPNGWPVRDTGPGVGVRSAVALGVAPAVAVGLALSSPSSSPHPETTKANAARATRTAFADLFINREYSTVDSARFSHHSQHARASGFRPVSQPQPEV